MAALNLGGPLRDELEAAGARTWVVGKKGREIFRPISRLLRITREFRPEIVHTHHLHELVYSWPAALLTGAKIVHTEHDYHSLLGRKRCAILRQLARLCRTVTVANDETANHLLTVVGIPERKVVTVVNGVNVKRFNVDCGDRESLGLKVEDRVVGVVARLAPVKNHSMLLHAFRRLLTRVPRAKLLVVGRGRERGRLEILCAELGIQDSVRFLGLRRDIPELLAVMDVLALCSNNEGLPPMHIGGHGCPQTGGGYRRGWCSLHRIRWEDRIAGYSR